MIFMIQDKWVNDLSVNDEDDEDDEDDATMNQNGMARPFNIGPNQMMR